MKRSYLFLLTFVTVAVLVGAVLFGAAIGKAPAQDVIVPLGPRSDIQQLYRSFNGGQYEAPVVALAPFDAVTGAALTIDTAHHEVHEGEMFHAEYTNSNLANAASVDVLMTTVTRTAHVVFEVAAGGQATVYLYEAPTISSAGTAVAAYNMNRTITTTPQSLITHTPVITATGATTLVNGRILPGGTSATTRVGGGVRQNVEWIFAPRTKYLIRATNTSGSAVATNVLVEWYEEEDD